MANLSSTGRTIDVPFSPLELKANVRVKAAQPDDAEVDLPPWALVGVTPELAKACQVMHLFAVKW